MTAVTIGHKVGMKLASKFGKKVIERWTRHRAEKFFEGFVESLATEIKTGTESLEADEALDAILDNEVKSEVLFDAYRSVCFAKSKTLGPKIVGILTGYLVAEGRTAYGDEEQVFMAAEALSDEELIDFFKKYREAVADADACKDPKKNAHWVHGSIVIPWHQEVRDSGWPSRQEIDITPLDFGRVFDGKKWALHLENLGFLRSEISQREVEYKEDSERHIDQDGVLTIYEFTMIYETACRELCDLIERCLGAAQPEETPKEVV